MTGRCLGPVRASTTASRTRLSFDPPSKITHSVQRGSPAQIQLFTVSMPPSDLRWKGAIESDRAGTARPDGEQRIAMVLLFSLDGVRPDAIEAASTPTLDRLRREGVWTGRAHLVICHIRPLCRAHLQLARGVLPDGTG